MSMEFARQEYWSGLLFSTPGNIPDSGIEPTSPVVSCIAGRFFICSVILTKALPYIIFNISLHFEFCLAFVMDREACSAAVRGVAKSQTWLSDWTEPGMFVCARLLVSHYSGLGSSHFSEWQLVTNFGYIPWVSWRRKFMNFLHFLPMSICYHRVFYSLMAF